MTDPHAATNGEQPDKRAELLVQLGTQAELLRASEGWQEWLKVAARFRTYSLGNQLLIWAQRPEATRVAGFRAWQSLGRKVRRGEKGIAIMAPMMRVIEETDDGNRARVLFGFKVVHVFDVSQTDGEELDELVMPEVQVPSDRLRELLIGCALHKGLNVDLVDSSPNGARGWWSADTQTISIVTSFPPASQCRTILHELGHAHDAMTEEDTRADRELVAESVAYLVGSTIGMELDEASTTYVTSWGASSDRLIALSQRSLDAAAQVEDLIDQTLSL